MSIVRYDEASKFVPMGRRRGPITRDQALRRRNALWLRGVTAGLPDPDTGRVRPFSTNELAGLFDVSPRTVQMGVAEARDLAEAIAHA